MNDDSTKSSRKEADFRVTRFAEIRSWTSGDQTGQVQLLTERRNFVSQDELDALRNNCVREAPYGTPKWVAETAWNLGLESTLRKSGRPKKQGRSRLPLRFPPHERCLTRARRKLIVIGDSATLGADEFFTELLQWFETNGAYRSVWEIMPND